jgi:hypothetical protein
MMPNITPEEYNFYLENMSKFKLTEAYHNEYFGNAPNISSALRNDRRIVLVGNTCLEDNQNDVWECPSDFLITYLKICLRDDWLNAEFKKPEVEGHEIIKLYRGSKSNTDSNSQLKWDKPNGKALAILHLSYDLFVLDNNAQLTRRLKDRIKNKGNFNGARYELFVLATLIRGGFSVEFTDEVSGKHGKVVDFRAKHKDFQYISVEAKTRNVKDMLGSSEGSQDSFRIEKILNQAIKPLFSKGCWRLNFSTFD